MGVARLRFAGQQKKFATGVDGIKAVSNSASTLFSGGGGGGPDYPNEPAGFTMVCHHSCDGMPGAGTATIEEAVGTGSWSTSQSTSISFVNDPTAPINGPTVMQQAWPINTESGTGPGVAFSCKFSSVAAAVKYKEIYVSYRFKIIATNGGWEFEPSVTKLLGYISYGKTNRRNQFFYQFKPVTTGLNIETGPWKVVADYTNEYQNAGQDDDLPQNIDAAGKVVIGWNHLEHYSKLNTLTAVATSVDPDGFVPNADGIHKTWVNGTLVTHRTDIVMVGGGTNDNGTNPSTTFTTNGFYQFEFHPIWGGVNSVFKSQTDYVYMCDIYVSGVPQ